MTETIRTPLRLFEEYGAPVYPGHPVALACYALIDAGTVEAVLAKTGPAGAALVSAKTVAGGQDALQATGAMLGRIQRGEGTDQALSWADEWWAKCIRQHRPAFDRRLEPGLEQARRMEPLFRELADELRARAAAGPPVTADRREGAEDGLHGSDAARSDSPADRLA